MKNKHKVLQDFQFISSDKKIFILKSGTIIEDYIYKIKNEFIPIDKDIIENNPDFFEKLNWKSELLAYVKFHKIPQPSQIVKKITPFIEELIFTFENKNTNLVVDDSLVKKLEEKELYLKKLEKQINDKQSEIQNQLKIIDDKEYFLKEMSNELKSKQLSIDNKLDNLNKSEIDLEGKINKLNKLDIEIKNWESNNFKLKRVDNH